MEAESNIREIGLSNLKKAAYNPRRIYPNGSAEDLKSSIGVNGIIDPLIVRPIAPTAKGKFEIVCGHRRFDSANALKMKTAPCIVRDYDDDQARKVALIENIQRETLHPMDEAEFYATLLTSLGELDKVVSTVGKRRDHVLRRLKLIQLAPEIKKSFLGGKLNLDAVSLLARMPEKVQSKIYKGNVRYGELSIGQINNSIQGFMLDLSKVPWKLDDAKLVPTAGDCLSCPKRTGSQPELFPEVKKGDACTDPECFQSKTTAIIDQLKKAATGKDEKFVELSSQYYIPKKRAGLFINGQYQEVKSTKCATTIKGLVVDGLDFGKWRNVCVDRNCKIHWGSSLGGRTDSQRQSAKAERTRKEHDRRLKQAISDRILDIAANAKHETPITKVIARAFLQRLEHETEKTLCKELGLEPTKSSYGGKNYEAPIGKKIDQYKGGSLTSLLLRMALTTLPLKTSYGSGFDIRTAARDFSLNVNTLSANVAKEMERGKNTKATTKATTKAKAKKKAKGKK